MSPVRLFRGNLKVEYNICYAYIKALSSIKLNFAIFKW